MIKRAMLAIGGLLLALGMAILGRDGRRAKRAEKQRDNLLATKIKTDQDKAERLNKKAEKHKLAAKEAAEATKARLDAIGEKDEDMAALLDAWDAERLRQRSA